MRPNTEKGPDGRFIKTTDKVKKTCSQCGRILWVYPSRISRQPRLRCKFCKAIHDPGKILTSCSMCGKPLEVWRYRKGLYRQVFCNVDCKSKWMSASGKYSGPHNPRWNGGKCFEDGYVMLASPGHPYAKHNGYVYEHRLVMEKVLGRYLQPKEIVHHLNGKRDDNRPENLMLVTNDKSHDRMSVRHALQNRILDLEAALVRLERKTRTTQ